MSKSSLGSSPGQEENKETYQTIKQNQKTCLQLAEEKIVIMEQSERELDNYIARLSKHIEKFQSELKVSEEQKVMSEEHLPEPGPVAVSRTSTHQLKPCRIQTAQWYLKPAWKKQKAAR
jgi:hypothetical protein